MLTPIRTLGLKRPGESLTITIRLKRNGPYVIAADQAGDVAILDEEGNPLMPESGRAIALCRCGSSSTKPFCDRSHRESGFDGTTRWTGCFAVPNSSEPTAAPPAPGEPA
jgi:CDGSH-type Zn-finger protein